MRQHLPCFLNAKALDAQSPFRWLLQRGRENLTLERLGLITPSTMGD